MTVLRPLTATDAPAVSRVYRGASVRFLGRAEMTNQEAEAYVARAARCAAADPVVRYVLGVDVDGDLVGIVKLDHRSLAHGRVGYVLRADAWGHGHATAAVRELVAFARAVGLTSLGARHHPDNVTSGRVLAKAGFSRLGVNDGMIEYRWELSSETGSAGRRS